MSADIFIWAQMFFDDGSVTQGIRVRADIYDDTETEFKLIAKGLLASVNRTEGLLVVWGGGDISTRHYVFEEI